MRREVDRGILMNKGYFRQIVKKRRITSDSVILENDLKKASIIIESYLNSNYYKNAEIIFAYSSMDGEIPLIKIIETAINDDKILALPKIRTSIAAGAKMDFVAVDNNTEYKRGTWGILEPISDRIININETDKMVEMIIPGLCFDINRNRIGYGGGYFDRYLAKFPDKFHITALAYEYQIFNKLPVDNNDKKVDLIVTENRYID